MYIHWSVTTPYIYATILSIDTGDNIRVTRFFFDLSQILVIILIMEEWRDMMKYLFCDLDGTLLRDFRYIDEADIQALQYAAKNQVVVSIATGRLDYEIKHLMQTYKFEGYRISQNGGVVYDQNNCLIHRRALAPEHVDVIITAVKEFNCLVFIQTENEYFTPYKNEIIKNFEANQNLIHYIENKDILTHHHAFHVITVSLWCEKHENRKIKAKLDQILPPEIKVYVSSAYTIDIIHKDNSKGEAIKYLSKKFNFAPQDVYVVGDSFNDISMFTVTPNSFVMEEATPEVKAKANFIVKQVKDVVDIMLRSNNG